VPLPGHWWLVYVFILLNPRRSAEVKIKHKKLYKIMKFCCEARSKEQSKLLEKQTKTFMKRRSETQKIT